VHRRCTSSSCEMNRSGLRPSSTEQQQPPSGAVAGEAKKRPSFGGKPFWVSLGSFRPYAVPPQLLNFRVKKPENIVKFGGSTYERFLSVLRKKTPAPLFTIEKKFAWDFFFDGKRKIFSVLKIFFEKNRKKVKKTEKIDFFRKRPMTRISREWCRFFVKRWDLEHLFGGGGYPHFSEYTKDRDPLFWGSFFDPFFHVFSWKKNIFGSKNFFRDEKKIKFFFHRRKKNP
jgi:hypothetical protein